MDVRVTRREFLERSAQAAALALLASCAPAPQPTATFQTTKGITPTMTLDNLDLKIGQMLLVGFRGFELTNDNPIIADLRERNIGGVVLFDYDVPTQTRERNVKSPEQVKALCATLQKIASTRLLISIDQEGGYVARFKERYGFPSTVSQQELGTRNDLAYTRQVAEATAKTLAEVGVNLNLAPVVDLNTNPENPVIGKIERSFSADPTIVTNHALELIKAHHERGVLTTLKHFPGHGSSKADSHLGFVDVTQTWTRAELDPYARIIQAGQCDAVMTAHVFNANLDPKLPATLSKKILTGILRDELKFDGVVITDDMGMKAIADNYGFESAIQLAIDAGADLIALANNSTMFEPNLAERAFTIIKQLVDKGQVSRERIEQSYQRIVQFKARLKE
ncbi:beta-N-acetylhexosaminidase [Anaerolineae bacterium]|nr:beta-N-acetylhexosaminidase [Anaerolineae bacterium]